MHGRVVFIDCNDQLRAVFEAVAKPGELPIELNGQPFTSQDLPQVLEGCEICIDDHSYMPTEIVARCPTLRHIVFLGTGPQSYMDIEALRRIGVTVHSIKGYGDTAVAEHALALILACARDLARMDRDIRAGIWRQRKGLQLKGKRLAIIGLGGIGGELFRMAAGIGMEVAAWNRTPREGATDMPVEDVLAGADVVSLHLALSEATRGFLSRERLALLKPSAILVNTARGALIDEAALVEALAEGRIAHAGLDVFALEPLKADHPLAKLNNVTLAAHSGFRTYEASANLLTRALDIVRGLLAQA